MHVITHQIVQFPWWAENALFWQSLHIFSFGTVWIVFSVWGATPDRSKSNCICLCLQAFVFASMFGSHCYEGQSAETLISAKGMNSLCCWYSTLNELYNRCNRTGLYLFKLQLKVFRNCFLFTCLLRNYRWPLVVTYVKG